MKKLFIVCACALMTCLASADEIPTSESPYLLSFYPLGELASGLDRSATETSSSTQSPVHVPVVMPGGGGFGGGGGQFSVPTASAQFGGGMAVPMSAHDVPMTHIVDSDDVHDTVVELVVENVAPGSWEDNGGKGTIRAINNTLLIRQSAENHKRVAEFLHELHDSTIGGSAMAVEMWWLPMNRESQDQLQKAIRADNAQSALNALCESRQGYHGTINARDHVAGHFSSGSQKLVVTSAVPVVGGSGVGYQHITQKVHLGLETSVTPKLIPKWQGQGVQVTIDSTLTSMDDFETGESLGSPVDRYQLERHGLKTVSECQLDRATIVGSLTTVDSSLTSAAESVELTLVVRVTKQDR